MSADHPHAGAADNPEIPFWVTRRAARITLIAVHVLAAIAVAIEFVRPVSEDPHPVERVPELDWVGSYAVYGFTGCVILVLLGIVLRKLVMRDEDYYQRLSRRPDESADRTIDEEGAA